MNVPKTPNHKLIGAARALANDALTTGVIDLNVLPAVLYEIADRLAELTQPQPIETAPRDGIVVEIFNPIWCKPCPINGEYEVRIERVKAYWCSEDECWKWDTPIGYEHFHAPTHWLPCVKIDPSALEGKGDE